MPKLSDQQAFQLQWLKELGQKVKAHEKRLDLFWLVVFCLGLAAMETKPKPPVDRRLVEEALKALRDFRHTFYESSRNYKELWRIHILLRRALEGEQDAQD